MASLAVGAVAGRGPFQAPEKRGWAVKLKRGRLRSQRTPPRKAGFCRARPLARLDRLTPPAVGVGVAEGRRGMLPRDKLQGVARARPGRGHRPVTPRPAMFGRLRRRRTTSHLGGTPIAGAATAGLHPPRSPRQVAKRKESRAHQLPGSGKAESRRVHSQAVASRVNISAARAAVGLRAHQGRLQAAKAKAGLQ
jgi:hypothetical protein